MSGRVSADIDDLRKLRKEIENTQKVINEAVGRLRSTMAHAHWDDAACRAFEAQLQETMGSIKQFDAKADALKPVLSRKIESLAAFLRR
jgi:DNA repair ATPase RecN